MAAILNVWISKPGDPCYVDDREWFVNIYDGHGQIYEHAGTVYGSLPAPQAWWAGTIPPGCYVVQATSKDANGKDIKTDHAIAEVGCEGFVCVRLYVDGSEVTKPGNCEITIRDVTGIGSPDPTSIQVSGTAVNCNELEVTVSCHDNVTGKAVVSVSANGQWTANVSARGLSCRCGGGVVVEAWCTADPKCNKRMKGKLTCKDAKPDGNR